MSDWPEPLIFQCQIEPPPWDWILVPHFSDRVHHYLFHYIAIPFWKKHYNPGTSSQRGGFSYELFVHVIGLLADGNGY